jgi:hypothetical protein
MRGMLTQDTQKQCLDLDGNAYRVECVELAQARENGESSICFILKSSDDGKQWNRLPMKLSLFSRIISFSATWPPESVDKLFFDRGTIAIEFRDHWIPDERPILPMGLDQESLWRASYDQRRSRWTLKRLRVLDYPDKDRPIYDY